MVNELLHSIEVLLNSDKVNSVMSALVIMLAVTYIMFFNLMVDNLKRRQTRKTDKFFKTLACGLKSKTINTVKDINNTYMGVFNILCDTRDSMYCGKLCKLLRKFLVSVVNNTEYIGALDFSEEERASIKEQLNEFIDYFETTYPFANLPLAEMNIMNDISVYLKNKDIESVKRKINELTSIIQVRVEDFQKLERANKWSVPLAVIGLILTIVFGLVSIFK